MVGDTAANLLASGNSAGIAIATAVSLTSAKQPSPPFMPRRSLHGFGLGSGATLVVSDTAANLLANLSAEAKATSVSLTGTANTVTAAQAKTLAALNGFGLASGATLAVADTAANLLAAGNSAGTAIATAVSLTGANSVTAAQATTLAGLTGFALASGATLVVSDTATNLLAIIDAAGVEIATSVALTGANAVDASQATSLANLNGFALASGATLTVSDNAADLLANLAGAAKATSVTLTGTSNIVTAAQAASLAALKGFVLTTGATLAVDDTAAQLSASIDKLSSLAVAGQISSIALTDSNPLTITYAQYTSDTSALGEITGGYSVAVSAAPVSAVPVLQGAVAVTSFSVSDTAANVVPAATTLSADSKLSSITATGTSGGDTVNLAALTKPVTVNLAGDTASVSAGLNLSSIAFAGTPDALTLGTGASTIDYTLQVSSGIETIAGFQYGLDQLNINLAGATLAASDTTVGGNHAVSLYSSADHTHGVVLTGLSSGMTASDLLSNHLTLSGGFALIS